MTCRKPLLLGTTSSYKTTLFERLGVPYATAAPSYEERVIPGLTPRQLAGVHSDGKADSLAGSWPNHLIICADQVLAHGDQVLTKPGDVDRAVAQLLALSGDTHHLHTAYTVLEPSSGDRVRGLVSSHIQFHEHLDPDFLRELVIRDQSTDCVGGYKYECGGLLLMKRVESEDVNAIVGLPLLALIQSLQGWGWFCERFAKNVL